MGIEIPLYGAASGLLLMSNRSWRLLLFGRDGVMVFSLSFTLPLDDIIIWDLL